MPTAAQRRRPDEIDLREGVRAIGRASVGRDRHRAIGGGNGTAREDVVVRLRVVADGDHRAERERIAPRVVDHRPERGDVDRTARRVRVSEEGGHVPAPRPAVERRDPAIDGAVIDETLTLYFDGGARADRHPGHRCDATAADRHRLPEGGALFVDGVEAPREALPHRPAEIAREARLAEPIARDVERTDATAVGGLHHAIDRAPPGAAPEGEGRGALDDIDALHVVEVAKVLEIVAEAVDEEVGRGDVAAEDGGVSVPFPLRHRDARDVADELAESGDGLIVDDVAGQEDDRLRGLHQGGRGAAERPGGSGAVAVLAPHNPDGVDGVWLGG